MSAKISVNGKHKKRDRSGENFRKRWRTFVKSGFEVYRDYHADVYIVLRRKGQLYEFKSSGKTWPWSPLILLETLDRSKTAKGKLIVETGKQLPSTHSNNGCGHGTPVECRE